MFNTLYILMIYYWYLFDTTPGTGCIIQDYESADADP
jgi:hypothetical protein